MAGVCEFWFHFSGSIRTWRNATVEWWYQLQMVNWPEVNEISDKFYELFCIVYGKKILSARRIISSSLASILFLYCTYYIIITFLLSIGYYSDQYIVGRLGLISPAFFNEGEVIKFLSIKDFLWVGNNAVWVNIIPDYVSLVETGIIIHLASRKGAHLGRLLIIDFIITTLIWVITHYVCNLLINFFSQSSLTNSYSFLSIYDPKKQIPNWTVYALTTYSTSFIWWMFLSTVFAANTLRRSSIWAMRLLESRIATELPVLLIVGMPCLFSWPILFIARQIWE